MNTWAKRTLNTSNVFWKRDTFVDLSNNFRKAASAPALTLSDVEMSTHPPKDPDAEEVPFVDVLSVAPACRESASFAEESRSRLTVALARPSNALIPNAT